MSLPLVFGPQGPLPQSPVSLQQQLLASVAAQNPGYTANLPGGLIEDISSTDVAATVLCDSFQIALLNSLGPNSANAFLLQLIGRGVYGVKLQAQTFTSVQVVFTSTNALNYVIPAGFVVSDGTYQYVVQDGGIIGQSSGQSPPLTCIAVVQGSWAIPTGTVTELVTSVPTPYVITCSNPLAGISGQAPESGESYRARVTQAGLAASMGMPRYIKTLVQNVPGVQTRLVSVQITSQGQYEVIVGGGDASQVAYAIWSAALDPASLVGSMMLIDGITNAANAQVTTALNHGYSNGQIVTAAGVQGMVGINSLPLTVTVIDEKNFTTGVSSLGFGAYLAGGVLTPNFRNNFVTIIDYPDSYNIPFVSPPLQTVTISLLWNTSSPNFVNQSAVAQLGAPAIASYVNSIYVGQPMNLFELQATFQASISSILSPFLLTRMAFSVNINGVGTAPSAGTGIIVGDPESYFFTDPAGSGITIAQG